MGNPTTTEPFDAPLTVASTDGVELAVYDLGGDGPDLLLVHATGLCAGVWGPLASHLGGFRRAALDVRGHGRSTSAEQGPDWDGAAHDVLATVDALGLRQAAGVGHSMGGALLVLAELARPGTFRSLWLFEPIIFPTDLGSSEPNPLAEGAKRRRSRFESHEAAVANFAAKAPLNELDPASLEAYVTHGFSTGSDGSVTLRCAPEVEAANYQIGAHHRAWDRLGELACPVTVVRGRQDGLGPPHLAEGVAGRLDRGRLEDHPELGHFGPLEDLEAMAGSIRSAVTGAA